MKISSRMRLGWAGLLLALLAGCGGGESNGALGAATNVARSEAVAPEVLKVETAVRPAGAPSDVPLVKSRAASLAPTPTGVSLGELPEQKALAQAAPDGVLQVGAARTVEATASVAAMLARLNWQPTAAGGSVAAVSFASEGAKGLRLGLLIGQLPGSSLLRFYSQARRETVFEIAGAEVLQSIDRNLAAGASGDEARTWWSPDFGSNEVTLEIELPPGIATGLVQLSVPTLSHIYRELEVLPAPGQTIGKDIDDSGTCNLDATCQSTVRNTANAVARMLFVKSGSSFVCTGTLLNSATGDFAPYFISANHCISTQPVASSLQTDWFFRSASCNSRNLSNERVRRFRGAQLLYAAASTDTSFLLLNDSAPQNASFAGWDVSGLAIGASIFGLHHPSGDLLKYSAGKFNSFGNCAFSASGSLSCSSIAAPTTSTHLRVNWSAGTTEGGSSGSGLFGSDGNYLTGVLTGGSASCSNQGANDYYGRFDIAYQVALKNWLNAPSTGPGPAGRTAVFRFYNSGTGAHFYTPSTTERDAVLSSYPNFAYEGVAFYAYPGPTAGQVPVYRFYNRTSFAHFYTASAAGRDATLQNPSYQYEGISWYAQAGAGNGAIPVYRFYNATSRAHFYTASALSRNAVIDSYPSFAYEGIEYYAWPTN